MSFIIMDKSCESYLTGFSYAGEPSYSPDINNALIFSRYEGDGIQIPISLHLEADEVPHKDDICISYLSCERKGSYYKGHNIYGKKTYTSDIEKAVRYGERPLGDIERVVLRSPTLPYIHLLKALGDGMTIERIVYLIQKDPVMGVEWPNANTYSFINKHFTRILFLAMCKAGGVSK